VNTKVVIIVKVFLTIGVFFLYIFFLVSHCCRMTVIVFSVNELFSKVTVNGNPYSVNVTISGFSVVAGFPITLFHYQYACELYCIW